MKKCIVFVCLILLTSCSTTFYGSPHISPEECKEKCANWGMVLDRMVAMGDYSDACICKKKGDISNNSHAESVVGAIGAIAQQNESSFFMMAATSGMH